MADQIPQGEASPDWEWLIQAAAPEIAPVIAETYLKGWPTASSPVALRCDDGHTYVVKGSQAGRMTFNDQVAGRLGALIGAPVPDIALVSVSEDLVKANSSQMGHVTPGTAHGSRFIDQCSERINDVTHLDDGDNRDRFAALAVFFGWMLARDRQFIYRNAKPQLALIRHS